MDEFPHSNTIYRDTWKADDLKYICGLANAGGGAMVISNANNSASQGFRRMKRPFEQIPQLVEKKLGIECDVEPVLDGANLCLEIMVPAVERPLPYNNVYWYYNDGELTSKDPEIIKGNKERDHATTWEARVQPNAQQKDLNANTYLALTTIDLNDESSPSDSIEDVLERRLAYLNLKNPAENMLTNAGVLILHNRPESFILGASVRIALFDKEHGDIIQQDEISGPLAFQINETVRLLFQDYLPKAQTIENTSEILPPEQAVREAITNAIVHKNYESSIPVRVSVYTNKLVIQNPATPFQEGAGSILPSGEASVPHNPIIANYFRVAGVIKGWGGSLSRMRQQCIEAGALPPQIQESDNEFSITFAFNEATEEKEDPSPRSHLPKHARAPYEEISTIPSPPPAPIASSTPPQQQIDASASVASSKPDENKPMHQDQKINSLDSDQKAATHGINTSSLTSTTPKNAPFSARSIAAANKLNFTATDEYVLRVLHTNGRATAVRIANVLGVSESTVRRSFRKLKEHGLIERVGSDKAGYWHVHY